MSELKDEGDAYSRNTSPAKVVSNEALYNKVGIDTAEKTAREITKNESVFKSNYFPVCLF